MAKKKTEEVSSESVADEKVETPVDNEKVAEGSERSVEASKSLDIEVDPLAPSATVPLGGKARQMRDKLRAEPKVKVFVPLAHGEKQGVAQSIILDGYPLYVRKGQQVEVPESVAEILEIKLKHKMDVENHPSRIGGDREVKLTSYGS